MLTNAASLGIGLILFAFLGRAGERWRVAPGAVAALIGVALLATALFGASADGAARWVSIASISLQPSLMLLPLGIIAFARRPDLIGTVGIGIAAAALALQPDRAMAGVLALGVTTLILFKPGRLVFVSLTAALAAFLVTLVRPDTSSPVPHVDQILFSAFEVHIGAGAAVLAGALLLAVPALPGFLGRSGERTVFSVFGAIWLGIVAAAALGNYPTPLVGYGGSAILGYLLSLAVLPRSAVTAPPQSRHDAEPTPPNESMMRVGLA
jgi:hypothetical protein